MAKHFDLQDRDLGVWDYGGAGPVVLLLHGFLDTGRSYDEVAAQLRTDFHVFAVDWRGHGLSRPLPRGSSAHLLDHLKDLSALVHALAADGQAPALIVAHSMGGNVALLLAGTRPELVSRLLLLDALGAPDEDPEDQVERLGRLLSAPRPKSAFQTMSSFDDGVARIQRSNAHLSPKGAAAMAAHNLEALDDNTFGFVFDPNVRGPVPTRWPEAFWRKLCRHVRAPTTFLRAEHGYVPDDARSRGRLDALARGTWVDVTGQGHHLHVDAPDLVVEHARALLATDVGV